MKRTTKYVGRDVHLAITAASVRNDGGRILARGSFATGERTMSSLPRRGSSTHCWEWNADVCRSAPVPGVPI
jgi:hypothetical protein